jgi:hypothetical protein
MLLLQVLRCLSENSNDLEHRVDGITLARILKSAGKMFYGLLFSFRFLQLQSLLCLEGVHLISEVDDVLKRSKALQFVSQNIVITFECFLPPAGGRELGGLRGLKELVLVLLLIHTPAMSEELPSGAGPKFLEGVPEFLHTVGSQVKIDGRLLLLGIRVLGYSQLIELFQGHALLDGIYLPLIEAFGALVLNDQIVAGLTVSDVMFDVVVIALNHIQLFDYCRSGLGALPRHAEIDVGLLAQAQLNSIQKQDGAWF